MANSVESYRADHIDGKNVEAAGTDGNARAGRHKEMVERYELYTYKQWLRVYMRSKMIKHNKDLFECVDDPLALLKKLHIY